MKVALYIRVSTERQANEGDSLEEQETELKKYCDFRQFAIHQIYIERGKSGGNTNRPEYQKLVKDIRQKKINAVVVKKLDRLSRSLLDFEQLMNLMNENEVEFISIKENFDTTTAMGKAMLRVALVFAQLEREQTSERIADVMGFRARQGLYNGGLRPLGYTTVDKEIVPYKKEKDIVEILFNTFLTTRSTTHTAKTLNDMGFRDRRNNIFDCRQVQWILQNPVYAGKIRWNGELYEGVHQPIISEKKFQQVQEIFDSKTLNQTKNTTHALLAKKVFCAICSSPLAPSFSLNRTKQKYYYYRCTGSRAKDHACHRPHFSLSKLEAQVSKIILALSEHFSPIENKLLKHNDQITSQIQVHEKSLLHLETTLSQLKQRKDKYLDSLLSSQFLSQERELIKTKITEMETEEKQCRTAISKQEVLVSQTKDELLNIAEIKKRFISYRSDYPFGDWQQHRTQLATLIDRIKCKKEGLEIQFVMIPDAEFYPWTDSG